MAKEGNSVKELAEHIERLEQLVAQILADKTPRLSEIGMIAAIPTFITPSEEAVLKILEERREGIER